MVNGVDKLAELKSYPPEWLLNHQLRHQLDAGANSSIKLDGRRI